MGGAVTGLKLGKQLAFPTHGYLNFLKKSIILGTDYVAKW